MPSAYLLLASCTCTTKWKCKMQQKALLYFDFVVCVCLFFNSYHKHSESIWDLYNYIGYSWTYTNIQNKMSSEKLTIKSFIPDISKEEWPIALRSFLMYFAWAMYGVSFTGLSATLPQFDGRLGVPLTNFGLAYTGKEVSENCALFYPLIQPV